MREDGTMVASEVSTMVRYGAKGGRWCRAKDFPRIWDRIVAPISGATHGALLVREGARAAREVSRASRDGARALRECAKSVRVGARMARR